METEESTEEELVGSPAPKNVKEVDAHEGEDHDRDTPTTSELPISDDEIVGTTAGTDENHAEKEPDVHKGLKDIDSSTTGHFLENEHGETATQKTHLEEAPVIHEEHEDIEFLITKHLSNNELDKTSTGSQELASDINRVDQEIEISGKTDLVDAEMEDTSNDIEIRGPGEDSRTDNGTSFSPVWLANSDDENLEKGNFLNDTTLNSTKEDDEVLGCVKGKEDAEHSSDTQEMETEAHHVVEQSKGESSKKMKSEDVEKNDDDSNDQQVITRNSLPEEVSKDNASALVLYGTREPKVEAISKASVLSKFVKVKSLYAISNVFRRQSRKSDGQNEPDEKDKDINDVNSNEREKENQEASQTTVEKPGWSLLRSFRISRDKDHAEKAEVKEAPFGSSESIAMKGRIVLYTKLWCQECKEARLILRKRRLRYSEINIDVYPSRKVELEKITGSVDVPIVFFNQVPIGGLNELKMLDESGKLVEKIEFVTSEGPSPTAPLPPFSGEDDVSSRGVVDELAVIVRKMKESIVVRDRFYKFRRVTNCFLGSEAVDFLSEDQYLEREEAIEFARKLAKELFFQHVLEENTFEDGNHLYRFLDQDPIISQCQNIPRGIIQLKRQPLVELSNRLRFLLYAILDAYTLEDGRHIAYRTIHGSEEFARYLRIAEELQRVDLNRTSKEERLAFFINLYNLMAIHAILVWGHPEGPLDRRKLFSDFKYVIGGRAYSLSDIHNGILRSNQRPPYTLIKPFRLDDKRYKVALPYPEPLIHFALVSGNRSAPALRCYSPKNIDKELMEAARNFLQSGAFILHLDSMTISVTKILKWYSVDFGKNEVEVLKHAANYLEVEKTQTLLDLLDSTRLKVVYQPYDWRLNS